ncbi:hypothetical protein B0H16DRAFT_1744532 [Mycena metata]|uniref:Uncharacterized protein n=1 Tax=Mycena metata TaxID=1033252 RepID=A0AAD7H4F2_9AGAR|nr:hypothetical protein B0H16DRAFT_1744532 [Mycena metata]
MARAGTAKRRRQRLGLGPAKPGKIGWVHGTKLPFFAAHKDSYLAAAEIKQTGEFYDAMAQLYLKTYGYNTAWDGDLEDGQEVADDVDPNEDVDSLLPEETEERATYFKRLRGKIGVWYKAQYGGAVEKKAKPKNFKELFNKPELAPPVPIKPREIHWYSRHFWQERIKPRVEARWAIVSHLPEPPAIIAVRNAVTKEAWAGETEEFRQEVRSALEAAHQVALKAYEIATSGDAPTTPPEYDVALNNAGYYLQPFLDAAAERFGMNVSLMMCGPVADRGGRIEVRSVHSGMSNGLVPRIWSDFDRGGFDAAQRSFIDFSHHCFTEADCRARALNGMEMASEDLDHASGANALSSRGSTGAGTAGDTGNSAVGAGNSAAVGRQEADVPLNAAPAPSAVPEAGPSNEMRLTYGSDGMLPDPRNDPIFDDPALFRITPPKIGRTLQRELDALGTAERELEEGRLMVALQRMQGGMEAGAALAMDSDDEDNALAPPHTTGFGFGGGSGTTLLSASSGNTPTSGTSGTTPTSAKTPTPTPTTSATSGTGTVQGRGTDATPASTSTARGMPAPAGAPSTTPPSRPVPRPAFGINAALQRPEVNPLSEGPINIDEVDGRWAAPSAAAVTLTTVVPTPSVDQTVEAGGGGGRDVQQQGRAEGGAHPMWSTDDESAWQPELRSAVEGFERAKDWGGEDWVACVEELIELERAWKFPAKGLLAAPQGGPAERPEEVPGFKQAQRRWNAPVKIASAVGPRETDGSFAQRWWKWWRAAQPEGRELRAAEELELEDWAGVAKMHGRNGMLLYVGGLLWWGEAAAAEEDKDASAVFLAEWKTAVKDVTEVLRAAVASVGGKKKSAVKTNARANGGAKVQAAGAKKRKRADTNTGKENDAPGKRTRRSHA